MLNGISSGDLGMGRKRKSGENYVRLCEMDIQHRIFYSEICDNERISYEQIKGKRIRAIRKN